MRRNYLVVLCLCAAMCVSLVPSASASHFRGAAMVPSIDANGLLTITTTSFWRKTTAAAHGLTGVTVNGSVTSFGGDNINTSDSRFDVNVTTNTFQLTSAGTYDIRWNNCCRVSTGGLGNWSESNWEMNSRIVWDGSTPTTPIAFNFASVQPEVNRNGAYNDNLNAVSPDGLGLSYNQALNLNINSQIPGFTVNTSTGALNIPSANTPSITDHPSNPGADAAFSGNIIADNGSFVEFDWMFDGIDGGVQNEAPVVADAMDMGAPGTVFTHTFGITDADGNLATPPFLPGVTVLGPAANSPTFNPNTGFFQWDSTGSPLGNYAFQVTGIDDLSLTDVGTLSITLKQPGPVIPEPIALLTWGGLMAMCGVFRMRQIEVE